VHRLRTCLHHAIDRALVSLGRDVAARIAQYEYFVALIERGERRTDDAYAGPQAREYDALLADLVHALDDGCVLPGVHRGAIEHRQLRKRLGHFAEHRSGEALLRDSRENRRHFESGGRMRDE